MSYRIVIAGSDSAQNTEMATCVGTLGHQVVTVIQDGTKVLDILQETIPDLLVLDTEMSGEDTHSVTQEVERACHLPIVLIVAADDPYKLLTTRDGAGTSCLLRPISPESVRVAVDLTVAHYQETQALNREVQDLKLALARRKTVERAKGVLMERFQLSEGDAYRRLQQLSQRENRPMMEVAQAVIMLQTLWGEEESVPPSYEPSILK
ncbi:MAG: ANTAR domain-containing response regulator [Armatimonadota bacterium]